MSKRILPRHTTRPAVRSEATKQELATNSGGTRRIVSEGKGGPQGLSACHAKVAASAKVTGPRPNDLASKHYRSSATQCLTGRGGASFGRNRPHAGPLSHFQAEHEVTIIVIYGGARVDVAVALFLHHVIHRFAPRPELPEPLVRASGSCGRRILE